DWRKALSDNNSAYVEVQAGLFRNQETYAFLQPRQTIRFSEYWMPVRQIGGISRANLVGIVNLARRSNTLVISLNANQPIPQASYRVPPERRTEDDWLEVGKQEELNGEILLALATYKDVLSKFPSSFAAQKATGRLAATLLRSDEAASFLEPVHRRDTSDTEISYY